MGVSPDPYFPCVQSIKMASLILYYSAFGLSSFLASFLKERVKIKPIYYAVAIIIPVALSGVRYGIGTDYFSYHQYYNEVLTGNIKTQMEPFFKLLNLIASRTLGGYVTVLTVSSAITHLFVIMGLDRVLSGRSLGVGAYVFYCFYYSASYNTVRQMIAFSIVFYATVLLWEGRYLSFAGLVVIASLFHISAIVSLILLPLKIGSIREDVTGIFVVIIATLSGFFGIFGRRLFELLPYFIRSRYEKYLRPDGGIITLDYIFDILPPFLMIAIPIFIYVLAGRKNEKYDFFCLTGLSTLAVLVLGYHFSYFQRLLYYFDSVQMVTAPISYKYIKEKRMRRVVFFFIVSLYSLFFLYSSYYQSSNQIFPYKWIL